jgi:intracellular multiplication protein IcmO
MMASALGSTIEGSYAEVVDTKPTTADMPFMTILDEYGYYAVKGSAVMPAQARSIGFSMIFAGQDLPAFEKASKEEAASIVANCNIKIFMKLEDPDATYSLFEKSVGEALTAQVGSMEFSQGILGSAFRPNNTPNISMQKRGNLLDLKDQTEGQSHIIFKSAVIRASMFYASPPKPPHIRMNYFVRVEPPDISIINQMDNSFKSLLKNITNINKIKELENNLELDNPHINKLRELLNLHNNLNPSEAGFATIAALGGEIFEKYDEKIDEFKKHLEEEESFDEEINIFSSKEQKQQINERYRIVNEVNNFKDDEEEEEEYITDEEEDINVFIDEEETKNGIEQIEKLGGATDEEAKDAASRAIEDMKKISKYPSEGIPTSKEPEEIMDILHELDSIFEMDEDSNEE